MPLSENPRPALEGCRLNHRPAARRADHLSRYNEYSQNQGQPTYFAPAPTCYPGLASFTRAALGQIRPRPSVLYEQGHRTQRYEPAAQRAKARGPKNRHSLAGLAHSAANACHIVASSRRVAQGCPGTVRTHKTINYARNLHCADSRTSAGSGGKPGAFGDQW